jgi:hypothetical protein
VRAGATVWCEDQREDHDECKGEEACAQRRRHLVGRQGAAGEGARVRGGEDGDEDAKAERSAQLVGDDDQT